MEDGRSVSCSPLGSRDHTDRDMSSLVLSVYRRPSRTMEESMDIDRRGLLKAGCLGLTGLTVLPRIASSAVVDLSNFQPMTKLLLERAQRASACMGPADLGGIESLVREEALAQGWSDPPVIKWLADPSDAFDYLSQFGLHQLLQMEPARLWRRAGPAMDYRRRSLKFSSRPWESDRGFSSVGRA